MLIMKLFYYTGARFSVLGQRCMEIQCRYIKLSLLIKRAICHIQVTIPK